MRLNTRVLRALLGLSAHESRPEQEQPPLTTEDLDETLFDRLSTPEGKQRARDWFERQTQGKVAVNLPRPLDLTLP